MYLLFLDETNLEHTDISQYFIFGGVFFSCEDAKSIDEDIKKIREEAGFKDKDIFKFETHSKPDYIKQDVFNKAKESVLELCCSHNVQFIAYLAHHGVGKNIKLNTKIDWASSVVSHK